MMPEFELNRRDWLRASLASGLAVGLTGAMGVGVAHATLSSANAAGTFAADGQQTPPPVDWLKEVQQTPEMIPGNVPKLGPLLVDAAGKPITTVEGWQARRAELRRWWLDFLGPLDVPRDPAKPPKLETLESVEVDGVRRELVKYEPEPGWPTEAYLLRPAESARNRNARLPAAIVLHSTVDHSIRQPAGIDGPPEKHFGLGLAKRGFAVVCPRNYLWPDNLHIAAPAETKRFQERHPKAKGMAKMLFDAQVALDILLAQPGVDSSHVAAVGHSLGAKEVLYLAALDDRVTATVSSEGGIGIPYSNWEAGWYLGPSVREAGFAHEHHELLALAAPHPFLLIGGDSADGDMSWPFIAAALPVYRLLAEVPQLGLLNHKQGHAVPAATVPRIYDWVARRSVAKS